MTVAIYMRVSKVTDQTIENQRHLINGWLKYHMPTLPESDIEWIAEEESSRKTRPLKEKLMSDVRSRRIDCIIVVRIDRFARSTQELISSVDEILKCGCRFVSIQNSWDFSKTMDSQQRLIFTVFSAFAQFERDLISERTKEGLARLKASGKVLGRPAGSKDKANRTRRWRSRPIGR